MRHRSIDFDRINTEALLCLAAVCRRLLPGGRPEGHEYLALNPHRGDRRLGSFKISLRTGVWADFSSGDKGGDTVPLVAYLANVWQGEAAWLLSRMLGLEGRRVSR